MKQGDKQSLLFHNKFLTAVLAWSGSSVGQGVLVCTGTGNAVSVCSGVMIDVNDNEVLIGGNLAGVCVLIGVHPKRNRQITKMFWVFFMICTYFKE
jgi:hypothetical protein